MAEQKEDRKNFGTHRIDQAPKPEIQNPQAGKNKPDKAIQPNTGKEFPDIPTEPKK